MRNRRSECNNNKNNNNNIKCLSPNYDALMRNHQNAL